MSALSPTAAEQATLRFLVPFRSFGWRLLWSALLFGAGLAVWCLLPLPIALAGLLLVLAGHLPVWARTQTNAPGGSTPQHEEIWVPVEAEWLERVKAHEARGAKWDITPWEISNRLGCATFFGILLLAFAGTIAAGVLAGQELMGRLLLAAPALLVPLWFNGMRSTWNPSELRLKGEALAIAQAAAAPRLAGDFEVVPLLALREGRRGKYPVDARLMLRPAREDHTGFLGVQLQVALNNVQGKDYPYLYAVVLGKAPFAPAQGPQPRGRGATRLVWEPGTSGEVSFVVVRQHADTQGGWHTEPAQIDAIVTVALAKARAAWRAAGGEGAGEMGREVDDDLGGKGTGEAIP